MQFASGVPAALAFTLPDPPAAERRHLVEARRRCLDDWGCCMIYLIARRLALGVLVAFTVMTLAFMLTRLSGDLAISIAGPQATQADVEIVRKAYGLDRPLT